MPRIQLITSILLLLVIQLSVSADELLGTHRVTYSTDDRILYRYAGFSYDNESLAVIGWNIGAGIQPILQIWNLNTGQLSETHIIRGHNKFQEEFNGTYCMPRPKSQSLFDSRGCQDGTLSDLWELSNDFELPKPLIWIGNFYSEDGIVDYVTYFTDTESDYYVSSHGSHLQLYHRTKNIPIRTLKEHKGINHGVKFDVDNGRFITMDEQLIYTWNLQSAELIHSSKKENKINKDCADIIGRMNKLSYFMRAKVRYCRLNKEQDKLVTIDDENDIVIWTLDKPVKSFYEIIRENIHYNWILNAETVGARWRM
ncbi:MAG: WD40 repeat domain-containing protein [Candidatus Thiodiazotropha sp. DIVDIV]